MKRSRQELLIYGETKKKATEKSMHPWIFFRLPPSPQRPATGLFFKIRYNLLFYKDFLQKNQQLMHVNGASPAKV